jgi:hypothetical protein
MPALAKTAPENPRAQKALRQFIAKRSAKGVAASREQEQKWEEL